MTEKFAFDVFLSHNSKDKPRVRKLAASMRDAGLRVWLDEWELKPGDDIFLSIERGLQESRTLIQCMSPAAFASDWVGIERSTVLFRDPANTDRRFVPLLLADCEVPDTLRRYKHIDYQTEDDAAFQELLVACRTGEQSESSAILPGKLIAVRSVVKRVEHRYRFEITLEAINPNSSPLAMSGLTINVPTLNSADACKLMSFHASVMGFEKPGRYDPGASIWGFLPDGSFGRKPTECLLIESVSEVWQAQQCVTLSSFIEVPWPRLEFHVRVWSNHEMADGGLKVKGDPDWESTSVRDQQGIPAYWYSVGF